MRPGPFQGVCPLENVDITAVLQSTLPPSDIFAKEILLKQQLKMESLEDHSHFVYAETTRIDLAAIIFANQYFLYIQPT